MLQMNAIQNKVTFSYALQVVNVVQQMITNWFYFRMQLDLGIQYCTVVGNTFCSGHVKCI